VFTVAHGPLNPPLRRGDPDVTWGRFDVPGHATVYGAAHRHGAFVEALAALAPVSFDTAVLFDDVAPGQNPIAQDWGELRQMPPGSIAAQWRLNRQISEVLVRCPGWYVDVMAGDSISTLRANAANWAPAQGRTYPRVDTSVLAGPDRVATCAIATWLTQQRLDDGSRPAGVRYTSKHGGDLPCWAVWVDVTDSADAAETKRRVTAHVREASRAAIHPTDPDLRWAASSLNLTCH
jgi:hypothetical protein